MKPLLYHFASSNFVVPYNFVPPLSIIIQYETTAATTTTTTADPFDPTTDCPAKGTLVDWKGSSVSKLMFYSETGALLRVNFFNDNANIDTVNGPYTGFLAYPKQV